MKAKSSNFAATYKISGRRKPAISVGIFYVCKLLQSIYSGIVPPCGALMRPLPEIGVSQRERQCRFSIAL